MATSKNDVGSWVKGKPDDYITCYIYNLITNELIQFKTLPDGVNENYASEWSTQEIMGRSAPYLAYTGNPARSVDYTVTLDRNIMGDPDFNNTILKCKRLVFPNYSGNIVIAPYCYIRFGGMVKMFAIVESVGVSWSGGVIATDKVPNAKRPWEVFRTTESSDPKRNLLSQCELSFSFTEIRTRGAGALPTGSSLSEPDNSYS